MNYNGKKFRPLTVSENGEVSDKVVFHYKQVGKIVSCTYSGGNIIEGQLIGLVDSQGAIDMRYQQVLQDGSLQTGVCRSKPEILQNGKIRLHETWRWTSGDLSEGMSILSEI